MAGCDADGDGFLAATAGDPLVWGDVGVVASDGDADETLIDRAGVCGIVTDPAESGDPSFAPGVTLRFLIGSMDVSADVSGGNCERTKDGNHEVREVLTDSLAMREDVVNGGSGIRDVTCVFEISVDVISNALHPESYAFVFGGLELREQGSNQRRSGDRSSKGEEIVDIAIGIGEIDREYCR